MLGKEYACTAGTTACASVVRDNKSLALSKDHRESTLPLTVCDVNLDCQLDWIWNQLKAKLLSAMPVRDVLDHLRLSEVERCILSAGGIREAVLSAFAPVSSSSTLLCLLLHSFTDNEDTAWASNMDWTEDQHLSRNPSDLQHQTGPLETSSLIV